MTKKLFTVCIAVLCIVAVAAPASACLTAVEDITAWVDELGPHPSGLPHLKITVTGFEIDELGGPSNIGCTIGLGTESFITAPPLWVIPLRTAPLTLKIITPSSGGELEAFLINSPLNADFNFQPVGYGYYSWPVPYAFPPFTSDDAVVASGAVESGPLKLVFTVLVKPPYTVQDVVDDLNKNGHISADYSINAGGSTFLLWTASPLLHPIDNVIAP